MSSLPCKQLLSPSSALRTFLEDLKHQTQINCIQIQCDNARKPAFCWHNNCCGGTNYLSRKNNSMPDMKSRANGKRDTILDQDSGNHSSKDKPRSITRPTSMPSMIRNTTKKNHMISRWKGGECDTRPILNAYWSDDLSNCSDALSPMSPAFLRRKIQEIPPRAVSLVPFHQPHHNRGLPNYTMALDFVRQKYATDGTVMMVRGENVKHRLQKRGQPLKCEESLIPPVRRQSIEDDDLSDGGPVMTTVLSLSLGNISP